MRTCLSRSSLVALFASLRPRQWVKNLLVVVAPLGAGELFDVSVLIATGLAFLSFCLTASATYLVNDLMDRERDRNHPTKSSRPIATGAVSPRSAMVLAALLVVAGLSIAFLTNVGLGWVVTAYVIVTSAYSL